MQGEIVFVYGALRSGTTLLRLMLDANEAIANPGEADFLFDHLMDGRAGAPGAYDIGALQRDRIFQDHRLVTPGTSDGAIVLPSLIEQLRDDRKPVLSLSIHRNIDRAVALIPTARIIHIVRDPRDVALSSIAMGWAGNTYHGVDHWIETERAWDRIQGRVPVERIHELRFENLITEPERELRRLCGFIGVPYAAAMLEYPRSSTYSKPNPKIVRQWRTKYTPRDLALLEGKLADLLQARGYAPEGERTLLPASLQRLQLFWQSRMFCLAFRRRRYGLQLVIGEILSRKLRLRRWNTSHVAAMHAIDRRFLK